jgi:hypothetical protein
VTQIFVIQSDTPGWEKDLYKRAGQKGATEGAAGRPAADATAIDAVETRFHSDVRQRVLGTNGLLSNELNRVNPIVAAHRGMLAENQHVFDTRHDPEVSRQIFENVLSSKRQQLVEAYQRKHRAEGHYNLFRYQHGITYTPDHPQDKLNYLSWIFLILAIETLLNAVFWTGSMGGFVTIALLISFVLSTVNIGIGFAAGALFAHKNRSETRLRAMGWAFLVAGIALGCIINYYIVTQRSTVDTFGSGFTDESIDYMSINNILSFAMFAVGMIFSAFAMYKGYYFFGSVPGYEIASSQFLEASRDVEGIIRQAREEIHAERRSQEDLRRRLISSCGELKVKAARLAADIRNVRSQYTLALDRLDDVLKQCVKAYRDSNRAVRASKTSCPAHFAEPVEKLDRSYDGLIATEEDIRDHAAQIEAQAGAVQEASATELGRLKEFAAYSLGQSLTQWNEGADREGLRRHEESIRALECGTRGIA